MSPIRPWKRPPKRSRLNLMVPSEGNQIALERDFLWFVVVTFLLGVGFYNAVL